MRLALTPRGPTLHFKVENYSLCKDVAKLSRHASGGRKDYLNPPLLVMNNFSTVTSDEPKNGITKHLESLTTTVFQSLFPPISPQTTPLSSIRRIMLLNRETSREGDEEGSYILNLRHYAITTKKTGIPRRIRRLNPAEQRSKDKKSKAIPNLGKLDDVADYLLDPAAGGYTSASETEIDTDAEVEVAGTTTRQVLNKRELQQMKAGEGKPKKTTSRSGVEKRAVKLVELGPRMRLKMMKIEEGLCDGRVMWHDFMTKSKAEVQQMDQTWDKKRKEKEQRKKIQRENVEKKKQEKAQAKKASGGGKDEDEEADEDEDMEDQWDSDDFDDDDMEE
jgi:ribosome biogenesis protein SSF1/2